MTDTTTKTEYWRYRIIESQGCLAEQMPVGAYFLETEDYRAEGDKFRQLEVIDEYGGNVGWCVGEFVGRVTR